MIASLLMTVAVEVRLANKVSGIPLRQICPTISHWRREKFPDLSVILFEHFTFFFLSHFALLSSVSLLPANPSPSRLFSFPPPRYQITRKANSVRPSTFLNPTPFFPFHRIFDGLIHQSTRSHHYRFSITSVLDNRKITAII